MISKQFKEFSKTENIQTRTYGGLPVLISNPDRFTILLVNHNGNIRINFDDHLIEGGFVLFLCPNEIVEIADYTELSEISFAKETKLREVDAFSCAYGNLGKMFKLHTSEYQNFNELFSKTSILLVKMPNNWKQNIFNTLLEIFRSSPTYVKGRDDQNSLISYHFISLVHEHYTMHHEMNHYAKLLGIPAKRIAEKFKALCIMPPHAFIKQRIIVEVKRQLLYTNKTVKLICFDVGFNDPAYFSRFFKKNTGMCTRKFVANYNQQYFGKTHNSKNILKTNKTA